MDERPNHSPCGAVSGIGAVAAMSAPVVSIDGVPVTFFDLAGLFACIFTAAAEARGQIITYANVHTINLASRTPWFRNFLRSEASHVFCDGVGLVLGARILGCGESRISRGRVTAPDFFEDMSRQAAARGLSMYLLAGVPGVTDAAISMLQSAVPELRVRGHHGHFNKENAENDAVLRDIENSRPDILCIGFGSPLQEEWILRNRERLCAKVILPLGAWLDFYTGTTWRGPRWITNHGGEWLCRLLTEPGRLWRRYLVGNPSFIIRMLITRVKTFRKIPITVQHLPQRGSDKSHENPAGL